METPTVFIGVIAVSVAIMAAVQIGIIIYGARLANRVDRLVSKIEQEIQPTLTRVNTVSGDVSRVTSLAVVQMERVDQVSARLAERCDHLMSVGQDAVGEPLRRSAAVLHGLHVALTTLLETGRPAGQTPSEQPSRSVADDQEALFIG